MSSASGTDAPGSGRIDNPSAGIILAYGVITYVVFLIVFLYTIGFVERIVVPKNIDEGAVGAMGASIFMNVLLLGVFGVQHTLMARIFFKKWWTTIIPEPMERTTYVMVTNVILIVLFFQWRPMPEAVWTVETPVLRAVIFGISGLGWATALYSTFLIDHFDLFGLRQVYLYWKGQAYFEKKFHQPTLYKIIRHPLMLGFLVAFWATPDMTQGHLLWAAVITAYVLVAIQIEEQTLIALLGDDYLQYRKTTPMLIPFTKRG